MLTEKKVTCIMCPKGCQGVVIDNNGTLESRGFTCKRGEEYGREEVTSPKRMLTTTVRIVKGQLALLPVVSDNLLPKDKIMDCVHYLRTVKVSAPVQEGDVIVSDILGLGADIIASRDMQCLTR